MFLRTLWFYLKQFDGLSWSQCRYRVRAQVRYERRIAFEAAERRSGIPQHPNCRCVPIHEEGH